MFELIKLTLTRSRYAESVAKHDPLGHGSNSL